MKPYNTKAVIYCTLIFENWKLKMSLDILDVEYCNIGSVFIAHSSPWHSGDIFVPHEWIQRLLFQTQK